MKTLILLVLCVTIGVAQNPKRRLIDRNVYPLNDTCSAFVSTWANGEIDSTYFYYRKGKQWSVTIVMLTESRGLATFSPEAIQEYCTRCHDIDSTKKVHFTPKYLLQKKPQ